MMELLRKANGIWFGHVEQYRFKSNWRLHRVWLSIINEILRQLNFLQRFSTSEIHIL